jgi:hypothetical protein
MSANVFIDQLEIEVETLEAVMPTSAADSGYPYPQLRRTGRAARMTFQAVILENRYCEVTLLPELGGRVIAWLDRERNAAVLPLPKRLELLDGGPRGLWCPYGVQWWVDVHPRLNSLGPVEFQLIENDDEMEPVGVLLHELMSGTRLSWHAHVELRADDPRLHLRMSVLNRALTAASADFGLALGSGPTAIGKNVAAAQAPSGQIIATWEPYAMKAESDVLSRSIRRLNGRQVNAFSCTLSATPHHHPPLASSNGTTIFLGDELVVESSLPQQGKVVLKLESGQAVEALAQIEPSKPFAVPSADLPSRPLGIAVLDSDGQVVLRWEADEQPEPWVSGLESHPLDRVLDSCQKDPTQLPLLERSLEHAHLRWLLEAIHAIHHGKLNEAASHLETALAFNAEDHLTWWLKAAVQRSSADEVPEDQPELLNAHFLAPMEPLLRAEAFLAQPQTHGKEPSPLVKPLANHPEAQLEIANILLEAGMVQDMARWIDECLRHKEQPTLRYLLAASLLRQSRMKVEAAQHVQLASAASLEPPFPWRPLEKAAIVELSDAFPDDVRLQSLRKMLGSVELG